MRAIWCLLLIVPGCAAPTSSTGPQELAWPDLRIDVTPGEPFEIPLPIHVTFRDGAFAIASEGEPDLRDRTIVVGSQVYANQVAGMGWVRFDLADRVAANSERLVLFDLQKLAAMPGLDVTRSGSMEAGNMTITGEIAFPKSRIAIHVEAGIRDGQVVWARLESEAAREAPYVFTLATEPFPFPVEAPVASRTLQDASDRDRAAHASHIRLIRLLQNYTRNHAGFVPDEPSPESMQLELLTSGQAWPSNEFTGAPMRAANAPGDFGWQKRGAREASYTGWGWDGALITQDFRS